MTLPRGKRTVDGDTSILMTRGPKHRSGLGIRGPSTILTACFVHTIVHDARHGEDAEVDVGAGRLPIMSNLRLSFVHGTRTGKARQ